MEYDDKALREAFAALAEGAEPGESCPRPEQIWAAIEARIPIGERRLFVDHMATCPTCAETWRAARLMGARPPARWRVVLRNFWQGAQSFIHPPQPSAPQDSNAGGVIALGRKRLVVGASIAVLALVISIPMTMVTPPQERAFRGIQAAISMEQSLARKECWLRWSGLEGARYDLTVMTEALESIVSIQGLEETEYLVTEEALGAVTTGERLLWMVEAALPSGQRVTSPTFISELR